MSLLITAETKSPIVHAGNYRCAFVPGRIVVEDIESHSFRQLEFFKKRLFAVLLSEPYAIRDQGRVRQRRLKHILLQIAERLIAGVVGVSLGQGEEAYRCFNGRAWAQVRRSRERARVLLILYQNRSGANHGAGGRGLDIGFPSEHTEAGFTADQHRFSGSFIFEHQPVGKFVFLRTILATAMKSVLALCRRIGFESPGRILQGQK